MPGKRVLGVACLALVALAPFAAQVTPWIPAPWPALAVAATQVAALAWWLGRGLGRHRVPLTGAGLGVAGVAAWVAGPPAHAVGLAVAELCHAAAYGGLLSWFAASLRPGREPLVTGLARRMRRTMPDKVARYTRGVTLAWCVFFAAELAMSVGLLALAPEAVWSGFVNVANAPLVAAMMLGEFAWRTVLFRHEPRTGLAAMLAGAREFRGARP